MSALRIRRVSPGELCCCRQLARPGASSRQHLGFRSARFRAYLLDRPVAFLCAQCAREWSRAWDDCANSASTGGDELRVAAMPDRVAA